MHTTFYLSTHLLMNINTVGCCCCCFWSTVFDTNLILFLLASTLLWLFIALRVKSKHLILTSACLYGLISRFSDFFVVVSVVYYSYTEPFQFHKWMWPFLLLGLCTSSSLCLEHNLSISHWPGQLLLNFFSLGSPFWYPKVRYPSYLIPYYNSIYHWFLFTVCIYRL